MPLNRMTSERQRAANRFNAKRSTGPRTPKGKGRASRNSYRHGLAAPASRMPAHAERIERLAQAFAGSEPGLRRLELARTAAAAQLDLCRVRATRLKLLQIAATIAGQSEEPQRFRGKQHGDISGAEMENWQSPSKRQLKGELSGDLKDKRGFLADLIKLGRYERRAFSRRKFAIRALYEQ